MTPETQAALNAAVFDDLDRKFTCMPGYFENLRTLAERGNDEAIKTLSIYILAAPDK